MAGCPRGVEVTGLLLTAVASAARRNRTSDHERMRTMAAKKTTTKKATAKKAATKKGAAKKAVAKSAGSKQTSVKKAAPNQGKNKMSALQAAAKVLSESKEPLRVQEMIEQMAAKAYWKSPSGRTPAATLHASMTREINTKGKSARFKKVDRGLFAAN